MYVSGDGRTRQSFFCTWFKVGCEKGDNCLELTVISVKVYAVCVPDPNLVSCTIGMAHFGFAIFLLKWDSSRICPFDLLSIRVVYYADHIDDAYIYILFFGVLFCIDIVSAQGISFGGKIRRLPVDRGSEAGSFDGTPSSQVSSNSDVR